MESDRNENGNSDCQTFFRQLSAACEKSGDNVNRGDHVRAEGKLNFQKLLEWEKQRASPFSPGPVDDSESIRKALFDGQDVVDGILHRNAFLPLVNVGLSADRTAVATLEESKLRFHSLSQKNGKALHGYVDIRVQQLRGMVCRENENKPPERALAVYDTADLQNASHAEAFMIRKYTNTKPYKSLLADLMEHYKDALSRA